MTATTEPTAFTAGDTLAWTKTLPDYPAGAGWVLKYRFINASEKHDATATASGDSHAVSIAAADSNWGAGLYDWQSWVEKGAERHTVALGKTLAKPNLAGITAAGFDNRSQARQILDTLLAAYAGAATGKPFVAEYEIAGRRVKFNSRTECLAEINHWKREVAREEREARLAAGLGSGTKIYTRF